MKALLLSSVGSSYVLGAMMLQEGHDVRFYSKNQRDRSGDGFVPKISDYEKDIAWADFVVTDGIGWGKINDSIRKIGVPVVGGTALSDAIEEDRGAGQKMFKALGMDTLPSREFTDIGEAIKYVSANPLRYVVKVSGKAAGNKISTYVGQSEDGSDIPPILEQMAKKATKIDSVEIQDAIRGVEVAMGGFFNGKEFLDPVFISFEHKRAIANGTQEGSGPNCSEAGTAGCWRDKGFVFYQETIERFIPVLTKIGYTGYFDVNCIIHTNYIDAPEKGPHIHPLELTCRNGWPTLPMQIETMKMNDLGALFYGMACGEATDFKVTHNYSTCVVIQAPPFPYTNKDLARDLSEDMPVIFKNSDIEGVYPSDVYCDSEGQWRMTGDEGCVCVVAAGGDTIEESRITCYDRVRNIIVPNGFYRSDISELIPMKLQEIKSFLEFAPEEVAIV